MLASCAGLLNLTVASVISLTGSSQEGLPFLSDHPNKLVLRERRPLHRSLLLFSRDAALFTDWVESSCLFHLSPFLLCRLPDRRCAHRGHSHNAHSEYVKKQLANRSCSSCSSSLFVLDGPGPGGVVTDVQLYCYSRSLSAKVTFRVKVHTRSEYLHLSDYIVFSILSNLCILCLVCACLYTVLCATVLCQVAFDTTMHNARIIPIPYCQCIVCDLKHTDRVR
jgi:hypothetical protein